MMKTVSILYSFLLILFMALTFSFASFGENNSMKEKLSDKESADTPFDKMMAVLTHQRCVNCHPSGDKPRKGDDSHTTRALGIARGTDGHGLEGLQCNACHQDTNNDYSGVPGAPHWALAPQTMAWEGLSRVEIAKSLLDRSKNGERSLEDIVKHLTEDELVLWAWNPGVDAEGNPREAVPVPKEEFIVAVKEWAANGALIPEE